MFLADVDRFGFHALLGDWLEGLLDDSVGRVKDQRRLLSLHIHSVFNILMVLQYRRPSLHFLSSWNVSFGIRHGHIELDPINLGDISARLLRPPVVLDNQNSSAAGRLSLDGLLFLFLTHFSWSLFIHLLSTLSLTLASLNLIQSAADHFCGNLFFVCFFSSDLNCIIIDVNLECFGFLLFLFLEITLFVRKDTFLRID